MKKKARKATIPEIPNDEGLSETSGKKQPSHAAAQLDMSPGKDFPIVGIGASAGGLAAFEAFFSKMPSDSDPGMAFVLVQHLAPDHKSILTELIQRYTKMQVYEVADGMVVNPNCAYIIPPNYDMALINGSLQLLEPSAPRGQRLPIDFFFRSLAQDQHEHAIGIILSGTGSDGTLGVRAIKGNGGMVMVQTPETTEFDGMPRNAIATGLVDYELPPAEMPAQLLAYVAHAYTITIPNVVTKNTEIENSLKKVFILLRSQTGHDFSNYKPNSVNRRIERRMAVHLIDTVEGYVKFLQQKPDEVRALFKDMLIGVTSFFRDPEAFKVLEEIAIPNMFAGKPENSSIRVWIPGCSTGEEAYSIAILLCEYMEKVNKNYAVHIFATDIDSHSIAIARAGLYPENIAMDISPERLVRFFVTEAGNGNYSINRVVRDMIVFSEQNLIRNPPFSKLDLISCRNLMIYLDSKLQKKLIPLFHYALNPDAFLFLGSSETVGTFSDIFTAIDNKAKLYQRKQGIEDSAHFLMSRLVPTVAWADSTIPASTNGETAKFPKISLREFTEQEILKQLALAAILVNAKGDILYIHGHTGEFLEPSQGEAGINNLIKMAREGLQRELTTSLYKAVMTKKTICCKNLKVLNKGSANYVNLTINPIAPNPTMLQNEPAYLVILEEAPDPNQIAKGKSASPNVDHVQIIETLKQELHAKEEYLITTNEELETSNEWLQSTNEELQSMNEEMQSTNEELETSKEELQSVNEELSTVNSELQTKVFDLTRIYNDMNNLLAGTNIATIFVDQKLSILRFTPYASRIINLISGDIGRSVGHIVSNLVGYNKLIEDTQAVLDTLLPKEIEVQTLIGNWFSLRIHPYRTLDNVIEGAVITFLDITDIVETRIALKKANDLLQKTAAKKLKSQDINPKDKVKVFKTL